MLIAEVSLAACRPACVWIVWVTQCSKLLHLLGLSSPMAFSFALMVLAYSLPFIRQVTQYIRRELIGQLDMGDGRDGGGKFGSDSAIDASRGTPSRGRAAQTGGAADAPLSMKVLSPVEVFAYVVIATMASYWAFEHGLAEHIQRHLLSREPSTLQQVSLCLGCWLAYMGCILFVFVREVRLLRRYVNATACECFEVFDD